MKHKRLFIILSVLCVFILGYAYNNFFTPRMIEGQYINVNYSTIPSLPEIPYVADTLSLFANNKFYNKFWGKGTYELNYSIGGTEIELNYDYEFGKAGYNTFIKRINFGEPKIILDLNQNHYYKKTR